MREPFADMTRAKASPISMDAGARWVCVALGVSIIVLALRIAASW